MPMNISSCSTPTDKSRVLGAGTAGAVIGMSAYYLPIPKDRFVRTAFDIMKEQTEERIIKFNEAAMNLSSGNRLKTEQKLFLSQEGVAEALDAVNTKITDLKRLFVDKDYIKTVKTDLANNFSSYKSSEALRDVVASNAFQKIRWTNFAWGAGICAVLASVLAGAGKSGQQD